MDTTRRKVVGVSVMPQQGVVDGTGFRYVIRGCGRVVSLYVKRVDGLRRYVCDEGGTSGGLVDLCNRYHTPSHRCCLGVGCLAKGAVHEEVPLVNLPV